MTHNLVTQRRLRGLFTLILLAASIAKLVFEDRLLRQHVTHDGDDQQQSSSSRPPAAQLARLDRSTFQQRRRREPVHAPMISLQHANTTTTTTTTTTLLPAWMQEYMEWHNATRQSLTTTNAADYKYFVIRCLHRNRKCSGASDRLSALPTAIRLSSNAKRLLFFQWERPAPLEEFFMPPVGGLLDWRLPVWLDDHLNMHNVTVYNMDEKNIDRLPNITQAVVAVKAVRGKQYYDKHLLASEPSFDQVYATVWNQVFVPVPAVQERIDQQLAKLNLIPGQYVAAHVRSLYVFNTTDTAEEAHAIDCAQPLLTSASEQLYFASDSATTTHLATVYAAQHHVPSLVVRTDSHPLHLDRGSDFLKAGGDGNGRAASDFYDTFVDLYLLSQARCVVYGAGGYGQWASLLSSNPSCAKNHRSMKCEKLLGLH